MKYTKKEKHTSNPQYFEGILQLRNPSQECIDFIVRQVDKTDKIHIAKVVEHKNGIDVYLSKNSFLASLAKKIQKTYGGIVKTSATLHSRSRETSKDLYRVTAYIELPQYKIGDYVQFEDKILKVSSSEKLVRGKLVHDNKPITIKYSSDIIILPKKKTVVSKTHPTLEVLHPENYQSIRAENKSKKEVKAGHNVTVIVGKDVCYIV